MDGFDNIEPTHYKLSYEPNLETFIFNGRMTFSFKLIQAASIFQLHSLELSIQSITRTEGENIHNLDFNIDLAKQLLTIKLDKELQGEVILDFVFTGEHNDKLAGWYRGKFKNQAGEEKYCVLSPASIARE